MSVPSLAVLRAYAEMAEMTRRDCDVNCNDQRPNRCCEALYCDMAIRYAESRGVVLSKTAHPILPLMNPLTHRCTAQPHLRPLCSAHHCKINSIGVMASPEQTARYFRLRGRAQADVDQDEIWEQTK